MKVYFIGAGPGDPQLITLKGFNIMKGTKICMYAGSLVNKEILQYLPEDAETYDTASMTLEDMEEVYVSAKDKNLDLARLHTGDLSIYSAIGEQIEILKNAVRGNTLAHAYLFTGITGIGKLTSARALAKILHCTNTPDDFCDHCIPCKQITSDTHPDTLVIKPEGDTIKINQIRNMQEQIVYTVYEGTNKIVIVDKADRMTIQSANCLLKTLEEPPPHTILALLTAIPYRIPSTIRSRCQRLMFQPLAESLIVELLQEKLGGEVPADIQLIASLAEGSIG